MIVNPFQDTHVVKDDDMVCYCFEYTKKDVENDYLENGRSLIFEKIAKKKNG